MLCSYEYIKEQLEKPLDEGKKFLLIKDMALGIDGNYDLLPKVTNYKLKKLILELFMSFSFVPSSHIHIVSRYTIKTVRLTYNPQRYTSHSEPFGYKTKKTKILDTSRQTFSKFKQSNFYHFYTQYPRDFLSFHSNQYIKPVSFARRAKESLFFPVSKTLVSVNHEW